MALLTPAVARAVEPADSRTIDREAEPETPAAPTRWYGWQSLPIDALAVTVLALSASTSSDAIFDEGRLLTVGAVGIYLLGGPLVHLGHGHRQRAADSLGLRLGAPLAAGFLGAALGYVTTPERGELENRCNDCGALRALGGGMIGVGIGMLASIVIDDFVLARETIPAHAPRWTLTVAPASASGGLDFGVAGTW